MKTVWGSLSVMRGNREELRAKIARLLRSGMRLPRRLSHAARVALDILYWTATFQLRAGLRRRRQARLIRRSGLFEPEFYLAQCEGDPDAQKDPVGHFIRRGAACGLDPSPLFDTSAYLEANPAAAAHGENPLVHFIRSGGAGLRGAPAGPSNGSTPRASRPGEALLLGHAFHASPEDPVTHRVLVIDGRVLPPHRDPGSARMFAMLEVIREIGHAVTFVSASPDSMPEDADALRQMGVVVHRGFPAALAHLAAEGHRYRWVLLSRAEPAFRYLPPVRAYASQATVIYDTAGLQSLRLRREAELTGDLAVRAQAERAARVEKVNAACSDVVLVLTAQERDALLLEAPGARIEIVPDVHASASHLPEHLSAAVVKGRLESILAPTEPAAAPLRAEVLEKGTVA